MGLNLFDFTKSSIYEGFEFRRKMFELSQRNYTRSEVKKLDEESFRDFNPMELPFYVLGMVFRATFFEPFGFSDDPKLKELKKDYSYWADKGYI